MKGTGIRSASFPPQSATTLLRHARKASEQSSDNYKSAGKESGRNEKEDEISLPTVSKRSE